MRKTFFRQRAGVYSAFLFAAIALSSNAFSEIYRWVDEQGNVHYGDSKPKEGNVSSIEIEDSANSSDIEILPIPKPIGVDVSPVFISLPTMPWSEDPEKVHGIGNYYVGESCGLLPTAMNWPAVERDHKGLIATSADLATGIQLTLQSLRYPTRIIYDHRALESFSARGGTLIKSQIVDIKFDACSQGGQRSLLRGDFGSLTSRAFRRQRAELSVFWQLLSDDAQTVLYESQYSGQANSWHSNAISKDTMAAAMQNSFEKLLSDPQFAAHIGKSKSDNLHDESLWEKLNPWKNHTQQAKLSSVLSELSRVKVSLVEYYLTESKWPTGLSQVGLSASDIVIANDELDDIGISADGRIEALLAKGFGEGRTITLVPDTTLNTGSVVWACETNLTPSAVPSGLKCDFY